MESTSYFNHIAFYPNGTLPSFIVHKKTEYYERNDTDSTVTLLSINEEQFTHYATNKDTDDYSEYPASFQSLINHFLSTL